MQAVKKLRRVLVKGFDAIVLFLGVQLVKLRDWFAPLSDLRIIGLLLVICSVVIVGLEPGQDVVRGMSDEANIDFPTLGDWSSFWVLRQWAAFLGACVWTGLNAWFWSNILYKTKRGTAQPKWFTWFRRFLGVAPLLCAIAAILRQSGGDLGANWLSLLCFALAVAALLLFFHFKPRLAEARINRGASTPGGARAPVSPGAGYNGVYLSTDDRRFVAATLIVSALGLLVFSIPVVRTYAAWTFGSAAIAFGAIGCIIPVTSIGIWATREARIPLISVGMACFALFSCVNDNHRVRTLTATARPAPSLEDALDAWKARHGPKDPMVLIATSGGASRAAYWTGAILRNLDEKTRGAFSHSTFAISSVSGGTLGAVGYAAWLADNADTQWSPALDKRRLQFTRAFLGADYLAPAVAGMLFPDLFQRFLPIPVFQDRAHSLEESWEMAWDRAAAMCQQGCAHKIRFDADFRSIWADTLGGKDARRPWVPLIFSNGTLAQNGKRIITAPVRITPDIFEDAYDFYDYSFGSDIDFRHRAIRASTAVMNSARFPIVSPAGTLKRGWTTSYGQIIDGGYFENSGIETLTDLIRFVRQKDPSRPLIIIEINNDDRLPDADAARDIGEVPPMVNALTPGWASPLLAGPKAIVNGLYKTRDARGVSSAKRLSRRIPLGAPTPVKGVSYFRFRLLPLEQGRYSTMSWLLSQSTRDAIDLKFANLSNGRDMIEARINEIFMSGPRSYSTQYRQKLQRSACGTLNGFNNFQMRKIVREIIPTEPDPTWPLPQQCGSASKTGSAASSSPTPS